MTLEWKVPWPLCGSEIVQWQISYGTTDDLATERFLHHFIICNVKVQRFNFMSSFEPEEIIPASNIYQWMRFAYGIMPKPNLIVEKLYQDVLNCVAMFLPYESRSMLKLVSKNFRKISNRFRVRISVDVSLNAGPRFIYQSGLVRTTPK
jgi:hypothetical protein